MVGQSRLAARQITASTQLGVYICVVVEGGCIGTLQMTDKNLKCDLKKNMSVVIISYYKLFPALSG